MQQLRTLQGRDDAPIGPVCRYCVHVNLMACTVAPATPPKVRPPGPSTPATDKHLALLPEAVRLRLEHNEAVWHVVTCSPFHSHECIQAKRVREMTQNEADVQRRRRLTRMAELASPVWWRLHKAPSVRLDDLIPSLKLRCGASY